MAIAAPYTLVPGSHIWIALNGATLSDPSHVVKPDGDATSYTVAGRTAKPSEDDTSWVKLGIVTRGQIDPGNGEAIEIEAPMPGALARYDIIRTGAKPKVTLTCTQIQPLTLQLLFRTAALNTASTGANPLSVNREVYVWLAMQVYGHDDANKLNADLFAELTLNATTLDPKAKTEIEYVAEVLYSPLNVLSF